MLLKNLNNMRVFLVIAIVLKSTFSFSQITPGYMGKRFTIGYSNYFMVAGIGPSANASSSSGEIGLNTTHCLNLEYTIKNRTNFCLSIQKLKTGMNPSEMYVEYYDGFNYSSFTATYSVKPYKPMQINSFNIGLGFKFFQSGTLAPIGKYKKVELLMLFNHLEYKRNSFLYYDYNSSQSVYGQFGTGDYQFNTVALSYTMGRSRVLFDRLVFDYGIRFGIVPAAVFTTLFYEERDNYSTAYVSSIEIKNQFRNDTYTRLFRYQAINFHLGLSFLTF